jgi:hypothetical protein
MVDSTTNEGKEALSFKYFSEAQELATSTLQKLLDYANANLDVVLFSGEGDSLHQIFDCIIQVRISSSSS